MLSEMVMNRLLSPFIVGSAQMLLSLKMDCLSHVLDECGVEAGGDMLLRAEMVLKADCMRPSRAVCSWVGDL